VSQVELSCAVVADAVVLSSVEINSVVSTLDVNLVSSARHTTETTEHAL